MSSADSDNRVEENELQWFVSSTLTAIMQGISDVQQDARIRSAHGSGEFAFTAPENVTFDVAVTAKHTGTARGGMKIQVFSIGANAGGDVSTEASTVSRIQFTIPTKYKSDRR
ncbi:trypco2 family protein [Sphingobium sp.]|uniref:trypco2 family protein n=1 Tax=Sphingobium sp. TaxID=1912891 RepID=UPI002CB3F2DF|nr:trypco2 family protein [Sphingobium sp.]HUD92524.1 trypco2 family protein [Sphingobium sp.]